MEWLKNKVLLYAAGGTLVGLLLLGGLLPESSTNGSGEWKNIKVSADGKVTTEGTVKLKKIMLFDQQVKIPMAEISVPEGWKVKVVTKWDANADTKVSVDWAVSSADESEGLLMFTMPSIIASNDPYLSQFMAQIYAQMGLPHITRLLSGQEYVEQVFMSVINRGQAEAWRLNRVEKAPLPSEMQQVAGQRVEAYNLEISNSKARGVILLMYLADGYNSIYSMNSIPIAYIGPVNLGFEEISKRGEQMLNTYKPNPEWTALRDDFTQKANQASMQANNERTKMIMDTNKYIADSRQATIQNRSDAQSRQMRNWSNTINQKADVVNPENNQKVTISDQYKYSWMDKDNNLIQNDNSQYNPNQDPSQNNRNWSRVQ